MAIVPGDVSAVARCVTGGGSMVQKQQVRKMTPVIETIPEAGPSSRGRCPGWSARSSSRPWPSWRSPAGRPISVTTGRPQCTWPRRPRPRGIRRGPVRSPTCTLRTPSWSRADGTRIVGIKAIVADARGKGPAFTLAQVGDITTTPNGAFTTFAYRYTGHGRGSGIAVVKIASGKIIRQWNFETATATARPCPRASPTGAIPLHPQGHAERRGCPARGIIGRWRRS